MSERNLVLEYSNHKTAITTALSKLREEERYTDVTVSCGGKFYPAHKFVLSACSSYFGSVLDSTPCKHPVIVLTDVDHREVESILNFMYTGWMRIPEENLAGLIKTAEFLQVKGLAVNENDDSSIDGSPTPKRRRVDDEKLSPAREENREDLEEDNNTRQASSSPHEESTSSKQQKQGHTKNEGRGKRKRKAKSSAPSLQDRSAERCKIDKGLEESHEEQPTESAEYCLSKVKAEIEDGTLEREKKSMAEEDQVSVKEEGADVEDKLDSPGLKDEMLQDSEEYSDFREPETVVTYGEDYGGHDSSSSESGTPFELGQDLEHYPLATAQALMQVQRLQEELARNSSHKEGSPWPSWWEASGQLNTSLPFPASIAAFQHSLEQQEDEREENQRGNRQQDSQPQPSTSQTTRHRHQCPICPYSTPQAFLLSRHMRRHTGEKPFACPQCSFRCSDRSNLKVHIRTHNGVKPFSCPHCSRLFSQKVHLKEHIFTHTGEKAYACPHCQQRYASHSGLCKHILKLHKKNEDS